MIYLTPLIPIKIMNLFLFKDEENKSVRNYIIGPRSIVDKWQSGDTTETVWLQVHAPEQCDILPLAIE